MPIAGAMLAVMCFLVAVPLVAQLLGLAYWTAIGRPGAFAETYGMLSRYESPFGMVMLQLALASLIPVMALVVVTVNRVRPGYLFSVAGGMRWKPFLVFLPAGFIVLNAVLWISNALTNTPFEYHPQAGFAAYLVAILLTSPLQAAAEEVFFRGYLLQALGAVASSKWVGIIASALVFALFHGTQNAWLFGSRFAFGVLAGYLVVRTGGLEAGIAAHVANNVSAFIYAGLSTGIPALKAIREVTPVGAVSEVIMYAVFTVAALGIAKMLRLRRTTGSV